MNLLKTAIQAGLLLTLTVGQAASAQWYNPYSAYRGYNAYRYNPYASTYRGYYAPRYDRYAARPMYRPYPPRPPYPIHRRGNGMPFSGNSHFMEQLWPGKGSIYDDVLPADGPWDRNWGRAPWNRDYEHLWGRNGGPKKWFNFSDPKEGVAQAWEDMLDTPNGLGTMPGGWKAPSISVPNPVDVGDQFKNTAEDMPHQMREFSKGFTYGGNGYNDNKDGPNDGISFNPGVRRN